MATETQRDEKNPTHHTAKVKDMLTGLIDHVRSDVSKVDDPKAQALFETSAEVLLGLRKAFEDFEQKSEAAWR